MRMRGRKSGMFMLEGFVRYKERIIFAEFSSLSFSEVLVSSIVEFGGGGGGGVADI